MKRLIYAWFILLCLSAYCYAETTTGGVTWLDSLSYQKPAFYPITVPDEATCPNKYYVDQASGSGSTCSEAVPCAWAGVYGKSGTTGGPAYIYLKGNARLDLTGTFYGSASNEIVIKPWPGSSTPITMTSAADSNYLQANIIKSSNVHHLIIDGGPSALFRFVGNSSATNENAYTLVVASNYITVSRCRVDANNAPGAGVGIASGAGTYDHIYFINNEVYNVGGSIYGMYVGGASNCNADDTTINYLYVYNNIFRDINASGIQNEPRHSASYCYFAGNAVHNTGRTTTRPALDIATAGCYATFNNIYTYNNLLFDLGGGGVELYSGSSSLYVYNNTIYDFAKTTPITLNSHGITSAVDGDLAVVRNNLVVKANNSASYLNRTSGWTQSNNITDSTGSSHFESVSISSADMLKLKLGSSAIDGGYDLSSVFTTSYFGDTRSGTFDVGADEYGSDTTAPTLSGVSMSGCSLH